MRVRLVAQGTWKKAPALTDQGGRMLGRRQYLAECPAKGSRGRIEAGFSGAAIMADLRACRFCGSTAHHARKCTQGIRRGWGWPGWERNRLRKYLSDSRKTGSPKMAKQTAKASRACSFVNTGVKRRKSTRSRPKRRRTSVGTPAKPA